MSLAHTTLECLVNVLFKLPFDVGAFTVAGLVLVVLDLVVGRSLEISVRVCDLLVTACSVEGRCLLVSGVW